jgi:hypothetical protein
VGELIGDTGAPMLGSFSVVCYINDDSREIDFINRHWRATHDTRATHTTCCVPGREDLLALTCSRPRLRESTWMWLDTCFLVLVLPVRILM